MPVCFAIRVNDGPVIVAGDSAANVLTTMFTHNCDRGELELEASGLVSRADHDNEHIAWVHQALKLGDRVTIEVVDRTDTSVPFRRSRIDPEFSEREERRYFEQLKKKYEPL